MAQDYRLLELKRRTSASCLPFVTRICSIVKMGLIHKLSLLLVLSLALSRGVQGADHCDLPETWYDTVALGATAEEWWCEYSPEGELVLYTFTEETISSEVFDVNGHCLDKYDDPDTMFSTVLFDLGDGNMNCIEAWAVDRVMMIGVWEPDGEVTIEDCKIRFMERTTWYLWVNVPFQVSSTDRIRDTMPLEDGEYFLSYKYATDTEIHCEFDGTSADSTLTVSDNQITSATCNGFDNSFEYPLNTLMLIIGVSTDAEVLPAGEEGPNQGFLMLAYPTGGSQYLFYCARYREIEDFLEVTLILESELWANCYAREEDYETNEFTSDFKWLTLEIRSTECFTDNPCQNGGECIQMWKDFVCECPEGFVGKSCEFSLDECEPWGPWSRCSSPCGGCGVQTRVRECPDEFPDDPSLTTDERTCRIKQCLVGTHSKTEIIGFGYNAKGRRIAIQRDRQCCFDFRKDPPKRLTNGSKACIRKAASGWRKE